MSYLSLSLKNNWGLRLREDMKLLEQMEQERQKAQAEKQRLEAEKKRREQAEAEQMAAEKQRLLAIYDSFSDEEKKEADRKAEENLNDFEKGRLKKHRHNGGGKLPELLAMSLEFAMLKVLRDRFK